MIGKTAQMRLEMALSGNLWRKKRHQKDRLYQKKSRKEDLVPKVEADPILILSVDVALIQDREQMKMLMKLKLKAKEVILEAIVTDITVAPDLAAHATADTQGAAAGAVLIHSAVPTAHNTVPAIPTMMTAIIAMVEKENPHLVTIVHPCLVEEGMSETGTILSRAAVWECLG